MSIRASRLVCVFLIVISGVIGFQVLQMVSGGGEVIVPKPFNIGDSVVTTDLLNVRDTYGTTGSIVKATLHTGTVGIILEGPKEADGYAWWRIRYDNDIEGWSSDHRLEKYTRPSPMFTEGDSVQTTIDGLWVCDTPGYYKTDLSDYNSLNPHKTVPKGTKGKILYFPEPRPRIVDNIKWWKVHYEDGTEGWSSETYLEKVTVGLIQPELKKTFSVMAPQGSSAEDTIVIYNPNDVKITVKSFTITDYGGFKGTVTSLTALPFDIFAKSNGEIRVRITVNSDCPSGTYTIKYTISGDGWEVHGD